MNELKISKLLSNPDTLDPSTIYFVADNSTPSGLSVRVSDVSGTSYREITTFNDYSALMDSKIATSIVQTNAFITSSIAQANSLKVVPNIADMNALAPTTATLVLVLDATSDLTVNSGAATYVWDPVQNLWKKIAEHESMDTASLNWINVVGAPTSTPAMIDAAVTDKHSHTNKSILDDLSDSGDSLLKYKGVYVAPHYATEEW